MMKHGKLALLVTALTPIAAVAQINVGDELGASETAILSALEAQGYVASEIEMEDGEVEVEAQFGVQKFEIEISAETGLVLAVYEDSDEDDDSEDAHDSDEDIDENDDDDDADEDDDADDDDDADEDDD